MAITRRLVAHDGNSDNFWLKVDHDTRFIQNDGDEWQFLFNLASELTNSTQIIKITGKFDDDTFTNLKIVAYLFDVQNASIANAATCQFKLYQVTSPDWTETLLTTLPGSQLTNNYFYINPTTASLGSIDFQGGDTIMIEATIDRLGVIYRDRIYLNHLGVFDNITRLKNKVNFLEVTKKDI